MPLKQKKYWLFDMDGTLTCAMHDFDAIRAKLDLPIGVPILEALAAMPADQALEKHRGLDKLELDMAAGAKPQPGCIELLEHLAAMQLQMGIVTRNGKEIAYATLKACGLEHFFNEQTIIGRHCCAAKPDPAGIHLLLQRWSAKAEQAVMVGDYLFDLEAGLAAGVATVHMDVSGRFEWPHLSTHSVTSLTQLRLLIS